MSSNVSRNQTQCSELILIQIAPQDDRLWLFNDQLCRSIWLEYVEDVKIEGIRTMRFTPPNAVFNFSNPDNYCYCPGVR